MQRAASRSVLLAALAAAAAGAPASFSASYRKDFFLPEYLELNNPEPLVGGRVHVVGLAAASGAPAAIILNGTLLNVSAAEPDRENVAT